MKISLPHKILKITEKDKMMSDKDKTEFVRKVLQELIWVNGEEIPLDLYFHETFNLKSSAIAMDQLAYFITKKHRERQDIMTGKTIGKMIKGDGRTVPFSCLGQTDLKNMGLLDDVEEYL